MSQLNAKVSKYFSGQGILLVAERDVNGDPKGFRNIGNVSELKLGLEVSTLEHKESSSGQRATDKRITTETKGTFSMVMEDLSKENLALALRGSASAVVGASATDESVIAYLGATVAVDHINISAVVVKGTGAQSAVTYELDKNYTVNAESGSINILADADQTAAGAVANIADEAVLAIDYTYGGYDNVEAMTAASKEYVLRFEGMNTADDNKPVVVTIHRIEADPLSELSLIGDEIQSYTVSGSILADSTKLTGSKFFKEQIGA